MKLNEYFQLFHQKIGLDKTRMERIKRAHATLRKNLENDDMVKNIMYETFLQGSYKIGTSIKPRNGKEFDVDVVVALNLEDEYGNRMPPSEAIELLYSVLKSNPIYKKKVKRKDRCVRIDYAGDFHMDVVPTHYDEFFDTLYVPDRKVEKWSETNPKGYIQWCSDKNDEFNGKFTRVAKFLKWWRNRVFGMDSAVKSIILTTLIGEHFSSDCSADADALLGTVRNLNIFLQWNSSVPRISNPSLSTEDLARDWKQEHYETFKSRVDSLLKKIEDAYHEEDLEKSIEKWRNIFGDVFPSQEEVWAQKVKEAQTKGKVLVSSSGHILLEGEKTKEKTYNSPPQRFYGEEI